MGGSVRWDDKASEESEWLRRALGDDFFNSVVDVGFNGMQATDAELEQLKGLSQLEWVDLNGTNVTDAGLDNLRGLSQLQSVELNATQVTDEGVESLHEVLRKCDIAH